MLDTPSMPYARISDSEAVAWHVRSFLEQLDRIWPGVSATWNGKATFGNAQADPNILASYSCWLVGQCTTIAGHEARAQGRVHFAGEHTSVAYQGFMEGGAESGVRAAGEILADYRIRPQTRGGVVHVVGTAGHVDHGKSALISALTGTNPDRLTEERVRGMTLDLGFAHLRFDDGVEGGIVDVPGHERFLHNMLAGAAGMELLLLVVDANEGVMPQTIEHLQILQFLNVRRVLVVVSKIDLVERRQRDSACRRIGEQLQGTIAAGAPTFAVSAVTGENLATLRDALHDELAAMPARNLNAPVYLPIDRAFALPGLGTVVTGTLMQGAIDAGTTLVLEPGGTSAHVRSIGVFESTRKRVEAGSRVALNLAGIDRHEIRRGHAIVGREFSAQRNFSVRFVPLQSARSLVRRRTAVRAYVGAAEILGTLVTDELSADRHEMRGAAPFARTGRCIRGRSVCSAPSVADDAARRRIRGRCRRRSFPERARFGRSSGAGRPARKGPRSSRAWSDCDCGQSA